MTDYQLKSILRMALNILESSEDLDEASEKLAALIDGENRDKGKDKTKKKD